MFLDYSFDHEDMGPTDFIDLESLFDNYYKGVLSGEFIAGIIVNNLSRGGFLHGYIPRDIAQLVQDKMNVLRSNVYCNVA